MTTAAPIRSFRTDFIQHARIRGDRIAVIDGIHERELTYADCAALIARYGTLFKQHGLQGGDAILAMIPNSSEMLLLFLAAAQHGLAFAPLSPEAQSREVTRWIATTRPKIAVIGDTVPQSTDTVLAEVGLPVVRAGVDGTFAWLPVETMWTSLAPDRSGRLYLTTSGSTGDPKAIVIDTDVLWSAGCAFLAQHQFVDATSRFFNILPMFYLGGLFNLGLIPLALGGSVVVTEPFSGRAFLDFWQNVERFEINVLWLVPTIVRGLLALAERTQRTSVSQVSKTVRACFLGTAPIDLAAKQRFEDVFGVPLLENFALSETTFFSSETLATRTRRVERSVGEILPYAELAFRPIARDEDDAGSAPAPTEILVRSPFLFLGYLQADGRLERPLTPEGYLPTGDLGRLDDGGRLLIEGRSRDIIKKGGYLVSLSEVERLSLSHPSVEEAVAVPVSHSFYGEDLVLCLRFKDAAKPDTTEFGQWLRKNLVKYKWPERIVAVEDFPRTPSGKIRKHLIKV